MGARRHENLRIHLVLRDNLKALQRTFASLQQAAQRAGGREDVATWLKLYVFDDGSSPRYADQIAKFLEKEKSLWGDRNLTIERSAFVKGYAQAQNELLALDPDSEGFVLVMIPGMEAAPDFFVQLQQEVLPLSPDKPRCFLPSLRLPGRTVLGGNLDTRRWVFSPQSSGPVARRPFAVGPTFIAPYKIFSRTLGWDPKMPAACCEVELSWRLNEAGWSFHLAPQVRLSLPRKLRVLRDSRFFRARMLLAKRHLDGFARRLALATIYGECVVQAASWLGLSSRPQEAIDLIRDTVTGKPI